MTSRPSADVSDSIDPGHLPALRAEALRLLRVTPALKRGRYRLLVVSVAWLVLGVGAVIAMFVSLFTDVGALTLLLVGVWAGMFAASMVAAGWAVVRDQRRQRTLVELLAAGESPDTAVDSLPGPPPLWRPVLVSVLVFVVITAVLGGGLMVADSRAEAARTAPSSAEIFVGEYLDALAAGDGDRAAEMDDAAKSSSLNGADRETYLNGAGLDAATEFITDTSAHESVSSQTSAIVTARYTLAGESFATTLDLERDDATSPWRLTNSLAVPLQVITEGGPETGFPPFDLGGIRTPESNRQGFGVYPGVYRLTVDVDEALLADPAATPVARELVIGEDTGGYELIVFELAG